MHAGILAVDLQELCDILAHAFVQRLLQQEPVELPRLGPLPLLGKLLAHEQELLSGVSHHKRVAKPQVCKLVHLVSGHLVQHRALQVHDLVVGERKDVVLRAVVAHGKGHVVVRALAHDRIELHILAEVMHPAHVPLEGEAKAVRRADRARDIRPGGGLLCDRHEAGIAAADHGVHVLEELDRLEVLVSAVLVGQPLSVLLAVVQVQHGGHRIHADAVDVVVANPVEDVCNQEVLHLGLAEVEDLGAPVRVLSPPRVRILIDALTVKLCEAMGIRAEVGRYPVEDDADMGLVERIHQVHEVLRGAIAGGRCIVARHLIPPGAVEGMLQDAHQLHMGELHLL